MNRTEAIIISAAVAAAFVPRFEAKVEQYVKTHRVEIQMAMNELQGKPAVPFAAPDADVPAVQQQDMELAMVSTDRAQAMADAAQARAEVTAMRSQIAEAARAASRARIANATLPRLGPQMAQLRMIGMKNRRPVELYRWKTQRCPLPPVAPAVPEPVHVVISTGP